MPQFLLCDNGSKQAGATLLLRQLAQQLTEVCGHQVDAVSLQHADAIDTADLDGQPAQVLLHYLRQKLQAGQRDFVIVPLFFGVSRALTSFVPEQKTVLEHEFGTFQLDLAEVLYPMPEGDAGLVEIVLDNIDRCRTDQAPTAQRVVLVDHGSPVKKVNDVRQSIAQALQARLDLPLEQACMERRPGSEYDFNGELLEDWLHQQAKAGINSVIVAMLFLLPGRHAGAQGDVEQIIERVMAAHPGFTVTLTRLVGENPKLVDLLCQRLKDWRRDS